MSVILSNITYVSLSGQVVRMGMMKQIVAYCSFAFLISIGFSPVYSQGLPECAYTSSDPDGDGYGWENRDSCRVTENSVGPDNSVPMCIDNDGDGWGWDGQRICRVADTNCVDTDPIGDGWGWDGQTSCQIQAYSAPFSELEYLRSHVRTTIESAAVSTLICPWQGDAQVLDLFSDGGVIYQIPDRGTFSGLWSSGFVEDDGIIRVRYIDDTYLLRLKLVVRPDSVQLQGPGPGFDVDNCFWL